MESLGFTFTILLLLIINLCGILVIEGKSLLAPAWIRKSGQFSWFYPPLEIHDCLREADSGNKTEFVSASKRNKINDLSMKKSFLFHEETILEEFNHAALHHSLQKAFTTFHLWRGKKYRIRLKDDYSLIISPKVWLFGWPFGWRHYPFKVQISENANNEGFTLSFKTMNSRQSRQDFLLQMDLIPSKEGSTLLIGNIHYNSRVSKRLMKSLFEPLIYHIKNLLIEYAKIYERRQIQHQEYNRTSQSAEEKRRKLERDRIIHPEKYKSKSPTVKGVGGSNSGGTSRYTPSADARSRREVRRGG